MWHEARKQERKIKTMIVDYRKRAERRQDFYEKIQADPTQFIQIHGRRCKIHLDPTVAIAGDSAAIIMPWQGQQDNLIDRFDVRAHLDYIPSISKSIDTESTEISLEERQCNYERYRILAQNDFLNVTEEKFLHQLYLEEQYGANAQLEMERTQTKKKQSKSGATIGYTYDNIDATGTQPFSHLLQAPIKNIQSDDKESDSDSDSFIDDMDVSIDVTKLDTSQAHEINAYGRNYGMISNDFYSYLTKDADEAEALRLAREEEQEKILLSGRKSRRERRAQKERRIACRPYSPPSYAAVEDSKKKEKDDESESRSPSPADANTGKITYITSFGGEDELQPHSKISISISKGPQLSESCISTSATSKQATYAQKVKENLEKLKFLNEFSNKRRQQSPRSYSRRYRRSRSRSYERYKRSRDRPDSRSRSRERPRRRHNSSSSVTSRKSSSNSSDYYNRKRHGSRNRTRSTSRSSSPKRSHFRRRSQSFHDKLESQHIEKLLPNPSTATGPTIISNPLSTRLTGLVPNTSTPSTTAELKVEETVKITGTENIVEIEVPPPPPLKRYYGRKRDDSSSSSHSESESNAEQSVKLEQDEDDNDTDDRIDVDTTSERSNPLPSTSHSSGKQTGKYTTAQTKIPSFSNASETQGSGSSHLNLRERLKRKMQNLLNKQYKADKRAEIEKTERERQMQQEREEEMRELALKLRRRQRELRHKYGTPSTDKCSGSERSEHETFTGTRRSPSHTSDRSIVREQRPKRISRSREREIHTKRKHEMNSERNRSRSPSHSYQYVDKKRTQKETRSRSRSRSRHSKSRRDQHSPSYRYGGQKARYQHDHYRGSSSRREHRGYRDQERNSGRDRYYERDHERLRERDKFRDRGRDGYERTGLNSSRLESKDVASGTRSKVVISAPPKLKKLVDY